MITFAYTLIVVRVVTASVMLVRAHTLDIVKLGFPQSETISYSMRSQQDIPLTRS